MTQASLGFRPATPRDLAGSISMSVARRGRRTSPVTTDSFGVLRLMQPLYLDDSGQVTYIIVNPGGAYFGETYRFSIDVHQDASLLVSSQAATRIHRTPAAPAVQVMDVTLRPGSRLEYVPDQTIAYRDADYRQSTTIVASPDAQAFFGEIVTPGWDPEGLTFTYSAMHLRTDVRSEDGAGLVCVDNLRITPAEIGHGINGIGYMEGASHMGTVLILGQHTGGNHVDAVREVVGASGLTRVGVTRGTRHRVSWLMVRALANSTGELHRMMLDINELDRSVTTGQGRLDLRRY